MAIAKKESDCKSCNSTNCSAQTQKNNETEEEFIERQALSQRMCNIKHKILVLSVKAV